MPSLSHTDLENLWVAAGGPQDKSDIAAAIAQAESGGCPYALAGPVDIRPVTECTWTKTSRENSCGLWQINLYAHPQYSAPDIFLEGINASAAVAISNHGADFGAWTTYTDGAYKQFLTGAQGGIAPTPTTAETQTKLTGEHGWNSLMRAMSKTAPRNILYTHTMNRALRGLTRGRR